jgi:hypothetical protein
MMLGELPRGATIVGDWHTHGARCDHPSDDGFSDRDLRISDRARDGELLTTGPVPGMTSYLGTQCGTFFEYFSWRHRGLPRGERKPESLHAHRNAFLEAPCCAE